MLKTKDHAVPAGPFLQLQNLEGLYAQEKGVVKTFSEQLLVDCDTEDSGCNGGLMELTFTWLAVNGGIMYDNDYPYTGKKQACSQDPSKFADMKITGYVKLGEGSDTFAPVDEEEMKEFLYQTGPLAIALDATGYNSILAELLITVLGFVIKIILIMQLP